VGEDEEVTSESVVAQALMNLAGARHRPVEAAALIARRPGLYALYGEEPTWTELVLTPAFDGQPLYVGKAEKSLNGRDADTHFATGKTGSSTVRRSLAAHLADKLDLVPVPRNMANPDGSANYSPDAAGDLRLSDWMETRLSLATWVKPDGAVLDDVETAVVRRLGPPLNLDKVASQESDSGLPEGGGRHLESLATNCLVGE
jgi:hypothetical protein